jgi:hypothetical protein
MHLLSCLLSSDTCTWHAQEHPVLWYIISALSVQYQYIISTLSACSFFQVGVHTYMRLLASGGESTSSFYSQEIVQDEDAVVPVLTSSRGRSPEELAECVLGLELLAHFISVQNTADYAKPISRHIETWCVLYFLVICNSQAVFCTCQQQNCQNSRTAEAGLQRSLQSVCLAGSSWHTSSLCRTQQIPPSPFSGTLTRVSPSF